MRRLLILVILIACLPAPAAAQAQADGAPTTPATRPDGGPWRIAYYQGGEYTGYMGVLPAMLDNLKDMGWILADTDACFPEGQTMRMAWSCLADTADGPYLRFAKNAFWDARWSNATREQTRKDALERLSQGGDIDLVIAMGTWAGQDLAVEGHSVPTLVASTSNPLAAGIIDSPEDSGLDHVHARIDPARYARQVRLFHEIAGFETLGVAYEDTVEGRTYAGLDQVKPEAERLGVALVGCQALFSGASLEEAKQAVLECHQKLAPQVDAFYITTHRGVAPDNFAELIAPFLEHKVPTFAMGTSYQVRRGAFMSMAQPDFYFAGGFYARTMAKILNGAKPRDLNQVFEDPHGVSVNMETARIIGFDVPIDVLTEAGTIYKEIHPYRPE